MPEPPEPERPSPAGLVREGLQHELRRQVGIGRRLVGQAAGRARDPLGTAKATLNSGGSAARMLRPVSHPLSPIMTGRSLSVRFDTMTASLPAMKAAAKSVDGRLNDAFVAAVAGGLDRYHRRHDTPVDQLRMTMPINVRSTDGDLAAGNQFVPARFPFPIGIADPGERMAALKALVSEQRSEPALGLVEPIASVSNRLPATLTTRVFGSMLKGIDVVTSNMPGAPIPIYIAGSRLEANFAFGPMSGAALNITLLSYIDELHMGINSDPAAVPDPGLLVECLQDGFDEIQKLG